MEIHFCQLLKLAFCPYQMDHHCIFIFKYGKTSFYLKWFWSNFEHSWNSSSFFRTLSHLLKHLHHVSQCSNVTGMTCRNLALVWAPNLLRSEHMSTMVSEESLRDIGVQARCVEYLIQQYHQLFSEVSPATGQSTVTSNLSCQDLSVTYRTKPGNQTSKQSPQRSFHGSFSNLRPSLLAACQEDQLLSLQADTYGLQLQPDTSNDPVPSRAPCVNNYVAESKQTRETKQLPKVNTNNPTCVESWSEWHTRCQ